MSRSTLVMLLAGGRGSRLDILAAHRAKPAVPFGGLYRIIDFALSNVMNSGLRMVGVLTQYRPASLMKHLGAGEPWDLDGHAARLKVLPPYQGRGDFDWYSGTADAVYQNLYIMRRYKPDNVLILSGDHIYQMDYRLMLEEHKRRGADLTIAAMEVPWEETNRFGIILTDQEGRITGFQEKPAQAKSNLASMGIYVFGAEVLADSLEANHRQGGNDFGAHVIPALLEAGKKLYIHRFKGYWKDVGTIDSYWQANMDLLEGSAELNPSRWRTRTNLNYENIHAMPPAYIAPGAKVVRSLLSPGCRVFGTVEHSVLSPGVSVAEGAVIRDSVVMHKTRIEAGATVLRSVVDMHVQVGAHACVGTSEPVAVPNEETPANLSTGITVIGKGASIGAGVSLGGNVIVHPDAKVPPGSAPVPDGATIKT
jgi:glucose-1-phosphate adenylyltransferase